MCLRIGAEYPHPSACPRDGALLNAALRHVRGHRIFDNEIRDARLIRIMRGAIRTFVISSKSLAVTDRSWLIVRTILPSTLCNGSTVLRFRLDFLDKCRGFRIYSAQIVTLVGRRGREIASGRRCFHDFRHLLPRAKTREDA